MAGARILKWEAMFERCNYRFRRTIFAAVKEANSLKASRLGVEHLALGLLRDPQVASLLANQDSIDEARTRLRNGIDSVAGGSGHDLPLTWGSHRLLKRALKIAKKMEHDYAGPEHLLLVILEATKEPAAQALAESGLTPAALRAEIERLGSGSFATL